jgi:hypothetical protein
MINGSSTLRAKTRSDTREDDAVELLRNAAEAATPATFTSWLIRQLVARRRDWQS